MTDNVLRHFALDGAVALCERYGFGHINETYRVVTENDAWYILQKVNHHVFTDVPALMENVAAVTGYLAQHVDDPRGAMQLVHTTEGMPYYLDEAGDYWRVYVFIRDSICLQKAETAEDFYESAIAFGGFQQLMAGFPAATLHETIPNFHNTIDRYAKFKAAVAADKLGRAASVQDEINFLLAREQEMSTLHTLRLSGELPLRVTHNDTKLNNVMLDAKTRKGLCVIDLDTVMPGLSLYDYGDSIRFGAATAAEDEKDASLMGIDLDLFRVYTRGFLTACPGLTELEVELMPLGAKTMTLECGMRFLTDYLDGDVYFAIHYPEHNLVRTHTQLALVADMEKNWDKMQQIVKEEHKK